MKRGFLIICCVICFCLVKGQEALVLPADSVTIMTALTNPDSLFTMSDTIALAAPTDSMIEADYPGMHVFIPNPQTSLWCAIAFPGLGQIYNRKYWKLPIVYGAAVGVGYAISWNNRIYQDYLNGYRDIMDNNPNTNSYMDLLPYGTDPDSPWARTTLRTGMNNYRRYRDLSIIVGVALYAISIVEAYVDAQLSDFDISPDLSVRVSPVLLDNPEKATPNVGLSLAINF